MAYSFGNYFDSLSTDIQLLRLDSVVQSYVVGDCCDTTLASCLTLRPDCDLGARFYNFASWLILKKEPFSSCMKQLDKRYVSLFGPDTFSIAQPLFQVAGDKAAPVTITVYISASCPLCKKVCIPLYMCVIDTGPLAHRARLSLKSISEDLGNRALVAADNQGMFWDFFMSLENENRRLDRRILVDKAKKLNLDLKKFETVLDEPANNKTLYFCREEAIKNGVTVSPTLFINNRRYYSYKDPQWVVDAIECEYMKKTDK